MSAPTLTREQLFALDSCPGARRRINDALGGAKGWTSPVTASQAREAGVTFRDLIWIEVAASRTDPDVARRLRLWTADCAAHVLHIYERIGKSEAPRSAIIAARRFARGEIGRDDLVNAREDARVAARDAGNAAAGDAAKIAMRVAAWDAANDAAMAAAWAAALDPAGDAAGAVAVNAEMAIMRNAAWSAWDAECVWQFDRLVLWLSDEEPDDWPLPSLNEGDA